MISRGFFQSELWCIVYFIRLYIVNTIWFTNNASHFVGSANNPFTVRPSYECWAPWIGSETGQSGPVLNTEFKKVRSCTSLTEAQLSSVTEDHLIDELAKQKVMLPGDEALWV